MAANKSQQQFAEETDTDQSDISKFESGAKMMSESVAERLAHHLPGTTPTAFSAHQDKRLYSVHRNLCLQHTSPNIDLGAIIGK